jgi:hypothetical protein
MGSALEFSLKYIDWVHCMCLLQPIFPFRLPIKTTASALLLSFFFKNKNKKKKNTSVASYIKASTLPIYKHAYIAYPNTLLQ